MKVLSVLKYTFSLIGLGLLVGSVFIYKNTTSFLAEAASAQGAVIELVRSRSSDSVTFTPVVRFLSQDGQLVEFTSSTSSNPPAYSRGEIVDVLYPPERPENAKIKGFFSLWGGLLITGILGGAFFLIGMGIIFVGTLKGLKAKRLTNNGTPIATAFQRVERNKAVSVNGRNPFMVLTHWQNPATSTLHVFKSNNLWFDPSSFIEKDEIIVFIEPGNPKKYHVDLSFLPKTA